MVGQTIDVKTECCAAGIQLDDSDLIQACIVNGDSKNEYDLTDMNECIFREVTPKMYQDLDGNPILGYTDFTEVTASAILEADVCCNQACSGEDFYFLLPGCPDR